MSASVILQLSSFGVAFGSRVVLQGLDLSVSPNELFVVMGPGGAGKSSLLRTLAGHNFAQPTLRTSGTAHYLGAPLFGSRRSDFVPSLVGQKARLLLASVHENLLVGVANRSTRTAADLREEIRARLLDAGGDALLCRADAPVVTLPLHQQRQVAIARAVAADPALLCVDEPTADLDPPGRRAVLDLLERERERRAILLVTHNRQDVLGASGRIALLVEGRLEEQGSIGGFFSEPRTNPGRSYVSSGYALSSHPPAQDDGGTPGGHDQPPRPPTGFRWSVPGALGGTSRPGLLRSLDEDLAGLASIGIRLLVGLEETPTLNRARLAHFDIDYAWEPIADMHAPSPDAALALCRAVEARTAAGDAVAYHCKGGLGRTGTLLAAHRVLGGSTALDAIESVRSIQPLYIQSESQVAFLESFERHVARQVD